MPGAAGGDRDGLQRTRRELCEVMEMSDTWIYGHDCTKDHWFVCLKWMHDMVCKLYRSKAVKNKPTKLFRLWGLGPPADTKPQSCQCGPATQASPVPPAAQAGGGVHSALPTMWLSSGFPLPGAFPGALLSIVNPKSPCHLQQALWLASPRSTQVTGTRGTWRLGAAQVDSCPLGPP